MRRLPIIVFILFITNVFSQSIQIQLGKNSIALNEAFQISLIIRDQDAKSYSGFPDLKGFKNLGSSTEERSMSINGNNSRAIILTNSYQANKEGKYTIPAFTIEVDGKKVKSNGVTITVGPPKKRRSVFDYFQEQQKKQEEYYKEHQDYVEIKDDIFLSISSNKKTIYEGEGFSLSIALFIPYKQYQLINFPSQFEDQLFDIIKNLAPNNCWEEKPTLQQAEQTIVTIKGLKFVKNKYHHSIFFPLNDKDIQIPSYSVNLIKYQYDRAFKRLGNGSLKLFKSKPFKIKVKPLPPHPLKNQVSVGDYRMVEKVDKVKLTTNDALKLNVKIYGDGNISAINNPNIISNDSLNFFKPNIQSNISRDNGHVSGSKEFIYDIIPNEPGLYKLEDKIQFIYFNYKTGKYDTLSPTIPLMITGDSKKNNSISDSDLGPFYNNINIENNTLRKRATEGGLKLFVNLFILVMLVVSAYLIIKK